MRAIYAHLLRSLGYRVDEVESLAAVIDKMTEFSYSAVLLDNCLGESLAVSDLHTLISLAPTTKIVVLTGFGTIEKAVDALNRGASGYLVKSDPPQLNIAKFCEYIGTENIASPNSALQSPNKPIIAQSSAMRKVLHTIEQVASSDATVLILGESGTGKELVARSLHQMSDRKNRGPFLAINCGAVSESLLEAELFGSKKGAFTNAHADRKGYFETCSEGTLFLDEVGEMSPTLQVKLLRVLQEREVTPLGSCYPIKVNTRIVAATNADVTEQIKTGKFRADLYYRLSVITMRTPPLRERLEDMELLTQHFIERANQKFGKKVQPPTRSVLARMKAYTWPGNARELANAIDRAVLLSENGLIKIDDLIQPQENSEELSEQLPGSFDFGEAKQEFERSYIHQLLVLAKGNISEVARISGQHRPFIYRLMQRYGLESSVYKDPESGV